GDRNSIIPALGMMLRSRKPIRLSIVTVSALAGPAATASRTRPAVTTPRMTTRNTDRLFLSTLFLGFLMAASQSSKPMARASFRYAEGGRKGAQLCERLTSRSIAFSVELLSKAAYCRPDYRPAELQSAKNFRNRHTARD